MKRVSKKQIVAALTDAAVALENAVLQGHVHGLEKHTLDMEVEMRFIAARVKGNGRK